MRIVVVRCAQDQSVSPHLFMEEIAQPNSLRPNNISPERFPSSRLSSPALLPDHTFGRKILWSDPSLYSLHVFIVRESQKAGYRTCPSHLPSVKTATSDGTV